MNEMIRKMLEERMGIKAVGKDDGPTFEEGVKRLMEESPSIKDSKSYIILSDAGSCICATTLEGLAFLGYGVYELAKNAPTLSLKIEIIERLEALIEANKKMIIKEEMGVGTGGILDLAKEKLREAGYEISDDASLDEIAEMAKKAMSDMVGESDEDKAE